MLLLKILDRFPKLIMVMSKLHKHCKSLLSPFSKILYAFAKEIIAGNDYCFLEDAYPRMTVRRLLTTPRVFKALFVDELVVVLIFKFSKHCLSTS
ncbi:hypothetical protein HAX54_014195 [Datura stramonium]|uniref:Uncharacterized protein n=1 Tax=Datura stramonium TaxID=4076 RepID=A0ABS8TMQ4_DATST|nr:hypothetical protein [Datura stramonium]